MHLRSTYHAVFLFLFLNIEIEYFCMSKLNFSDLLYRLQQNRLSYKGASLLAAELFQQYFMGNNVRNSNRAHLTVTMCTFEIHDVGPEQIKRNYFS